MGSMPETFASAGIQTVSDLAEDSLKKKLLMRKKSWTRLVRFIAVEDNNEHIGEPVNPDLDGMSLRPQPDMHAMLILYSRCSSCLRIQCRSSRVPWLIGVRFGYATNNKDSLHFTAVASVIQVRNRYYSLHRAKLPETCQGDELGAAKPSYVVL